MAYDAIDVAKYVVSYCNNKGRPISNLKLQQMLYFIWIEYYKLEGTELFVNEICAWLSGPVVPEVYYEFCSYGGIPIRQTNVGSEKVFSDKDKRIVSSVIEGYLLKSVKILVDITHKEGSPWYEIYQDGDGLRKIIPFSLIISKECI